jgi:hypothetical protein
LHLPEAPSCAISSLTAVLKHTSRGAIPHGAGALTNLRLTVGWNMIWLWDL